MSDGRKLWLSKATQSKCKTTPRSRIQLASGISIPYWEEKHCCRIVLKTFRLQQLSTEVTKMI